MKSVLTSSLFSSVLPEKVVISRGTTQILVTEKAQNATIRLEEGSRLTFLLFCTEGWNETAKLTFEFVGKESSLQFLGVIIGTGMHQFPFETVSQHLVASTRADYLVKAAMFDASSVDYRGNIIIRPEAPLSDTHLRHDTLLLSKQARARTIPALEIEADDVKAGHAATLGKVDDELMFYLQSRGIDRKEAEQMLISGFFESLFAFLPDTELQEEVRRRILCHIPSA